MTRKNKILISVLLLIAMLLIVLPLLFMRGASFGGSDDAGSKMVESIDGNYQPWAVPVLEKLIGGEIPSEMETLLFCIQTGIGAGIIAFILGRMVERKAQEKKSGTGNPEIKRTEAPEDGSDDSCAYIKKDDESVGFPEDEAGNRPALVAASFGTTHRDTYEKTILAVEDEFRKALPSFTVHEVFLSMMIRKVLQKRDGLTVDGICEALRKLSDAGIRDVVIQPTLVMGGTEYDLLKSDAARFAGHFRKLLIGAPLLTSDEDYHTLIHVLDEAYGIHQNPDTVFVLAGHGTPHAADASYAALSYRFRAEGFFNVEVGTVEGYPSFEDVLVAMQTRKKVMPAKADIQKEAGGISDQGNSSQTDASRKTDAVSSGYQEQSSCHDQPSEVVILPLMLVAGDHIQNDIAGESPDSWSRRLGEAGYRVSVKMTGLGELEGIRKMFMKHAEEEMARGDLSWK